MNSFASEALFITAKDVAKVRAEIWTETWPGQTGHFEANTATADM